jgi:ribosomal protein S18 acetylase RimI-like enzyme
VQIEMGRASAADVERVLGTVPSWFGIPTAVRDYVEYARSSPVWSAEVDDEVVGVLLLRRHSDVSAEIHLLAVEPQFHRRGVGSALLAAVERDLAAENVRLLHVKTLGPTHPSPEYARTRAFYEARGFVPMEELPDFWPGNPCLVMVKPLGVREPGLREDSATQS